MRPLFLIAAILLLPLQVMAQTPITNEIAGAYFNNCMSKSDPRLTRESQEALCSCTSAKMMETMSVEDIQIMAANTPQGREKLNFMMLNVYTPCITYPVQDIAYARCIDEDKIDMMNLATISKEALCTCVSRKTGDWMSVNAGTMMAGFLQSDPNMTDPMTPVIESPAFEKASYDNLIACLNNK
jgi:hypothetical protein